MKNHLSDGFLLLHKIPQSPADSWLSRQETKGQMETRQAWERAMRAHREQSMKIPERGLISLPTWQGHSSCHMLSLHCLSWNKAKLGAGAEEMLGAHSYLSKVSHPVSALVCSWTGQSHLVLFLQKALQPRSQGA